MKWSLQQLQKFNGKAFDFTTTYDFKEEIQNIDDILDISIANVEGVGQNIYQSKFRFELQISVVLTLEDARTLEPVEFPVNLKVIEIYDREVSDEEVRLIEKNTIDLRPLVWECIILEKPIRVVKE